MSDGKKNKSGGAGERAKFIENKHSKYDRKLTDVPKTKVVDTVPPPKFKPEKNE